MINKLTQMMRKKVIAERKGKRKTEKRKRKKQGGLS